jgi:hypothetical protein
VLQALDEHRRASLARGVKDEGHWVLKWRERRALGEINERKLQPGNGLTLEERAAFPQQADKGVDFVPIGEVAEGVKGDTLRALHMIVEDRNCQRRVLEPKDAILPSNAQG